MHHKPGLLSLQALQLFRRRVLFANIENDRTVPFCTGAIRGSNPYRGSAPTLLFGREQYPSLVRPAEVSHHCESRKEAIELYLRGGWQRSEIPGQK